MMARAGAWATAIQNAVATAEGGKYVRTTRFVSIGAGTSGTASLPLNSQVVLDDFGGTVDAVVTQISGGKPTSLPALTASGAVVATTFDASGNWVFSGTPASYPVGIVYRVQTQLAAFDSTSSDIWGDAENIGVNPVANGGTGLSSWVTGDIVYASGTNVLAAFAANATGTKKFMSMTSSVPSWVQAAFSDLTGTASAAQLPDPSSTTKGGVKSLAAVTSNWLRSIGTDGTPTQSQPAFSDLSGTASAAQLPDPSSTTKGGVKSLAPIASNWLRSIGTDGTPTQSQPAFSDLSGSATAAQLPNPAAGALGGVRSITAVSHQFLTSISTLGQPTQAQPAFSDISGTAVAAQIPILTPTSGTAATMWALAGTDGQMFWNTDYKVMFISTNGRWMPTGLDPRSGFMLFDEFDGSDRIGMRDWQTNGSAPSAAGNLLNPGMFKLSISAASNLTYLTTQLNSIQLGAGLDLYIEALVSIDQLSDGTNNLGFAFGLNDGTSYSATSAGTDGIYIRYDNATNTNKWIANTSSNSSVTGVNSTTAIVAATFYRLGILITGATSARYFVNGTEIVNIGTGITTNLPTGAGRQTGLSFRIDKQLGAGAVTASLDYALIMGFYSGAQRAS